MSLICLSLRIHTHEQVFRKRGGKEQEMEKSLKLDAWQKEKINDDYAGEIGRIS